MGAVASAVGGAIGGVANAIFEPIKSVGQIAESAVREVGHAVESVGREVGKIGQAAIDDPVGTIAKVGAVASGQWWALPLVSAGLVIANGGDIGQAALAAGISLAAQGVAYGVGEALGAGSSAALDMAAPDAANLASQGLTAGQIAQVLGQAYPEIGASAISQMAGMATLGLSAAEIASDVGGQMAMQNLGASTAANALGAGTRSSLSGGDLSDFLTAAGTAGLGTAVGGGTSMAAKDLGAGSKLASAIGKGTGAYVATTAAGKDGTAAFLNSLINTTLSEAGAQTKSYLGTKWNELKQYVSEYNTQLDAAGQKQAGLSSLYEAAKEAGADSDSKLDAYKPLREKFSDLVTRYDAAVAANDRTLANSLADEANALIPELTAATNAYNDAYANYETKNNAYVAEVTSYGNEIAKAEKLKTRYEQTDEEVKQEAKALTDAAAKVVDMPEPVQNSFAKMYQNGESVEDSLARSEDLSNKSTVSQEAFLRNIEQNNNTEQALAFADTINSLDNKQQSAFQLGIDKGLNDNTALEVAPVISNYNANQQSAYVGAIAKGYGQEGADLISAFASFAPEQTSQVTVEPGPKDTVSEFTKLSLTDQAKVKDLLNDRFNPMTLTDALDTVLSSVVGEAQASQTPFIGKTPEGQNLVESIYQQDASGKWHEYVPDESGQYTKDTGAVLAGDYTAGPSGSKYVVDTTADENGVPSLSMTPYEGSTTTSAEGPAMTAEEEAAYQKQLAEADAAAQGQSSAGATTPASEQPLEFLNNEQVADFTGSGAPITSTTAGASSSPAVGATTGTGTASGTTTGAGGTTGTGTGNTGTVGAGAATGPGAGQGTGNTAGTGTGSAPGEGDGTGTGSGLGLTAGLTGSAGGYGGWAALQSQNQFGGIKDLAPGLTNRMDYTLSGLPTDMGQDTVNPMSDIRGYATGGITSLTSGFNTSTTDSSSGINNGIEGSLKPGLSKAQIQYILTGLPGSNISVPGKAEGGMIEGHNPTFFSEGGLNSMENRYVEGEGDGTSDSVAAMLANGEFVIPADVVSKLGNGSNEAGAGVLDQFLVEIRKHAHSNGEKLPPESKGPLGYLLDAKRKVKA